MNRASFRLRHVSEEVPVNPQGGRSCSTPTQQRQGCNNGPRRHTLACYFPAANIFRCKNGTQYFPLQSRFNCCKTASCFYGCKIKVVAAKCEFVAALLRLQLQMWPLQQQKSAALCNFRIVAVTARDTQRAAPLSL